MRVDAKSLLDRLGRSEFNYREFADRFSDLELWPLFEALLHDERLGLVSQRDKATASSPPSVVPHSPEPVGSMKVHPRESTNQPLSSVFARLEAASTEAHQEPARNSTGYGGGLDLNSRDVRNLLNQLAELQRKGEL